ncbi:MULTISPECIES: replication initiation protein [Empedobacter]|uniref:RepB family plasmid replication initiator protein n=1 Tax=Empedobacter falsenii TaxID=343874 RepID=A0A3R8UAZ3_9FLAO|nr:MULTISPECIES: replication initiation protein [Empedobacter]MDH0675595.1 replication initiation protein [Empedobacter sp. GD03861]RRT86370.1 RepB family plasmid replication initiator protein [Empedobacter falsenii]RRT87425.1 RepB family plasmid replication initiator protein [Empedobacter falsenii]
MKSINNKEILQSYILTTAKYDYTVYEKRILYRIIEVLQELIIQKTLNKKYDLNITDKKDFDFSIPLSSFLKDEYDENYTRAKQALESLNNKIIKYEDEDTWAIINLIERPEIVKRHNNSIAKFRLHPHIAECFLDFSKGYKKYELKVAMQFESVFSMRFYELFSNQKKPINFSIDRLKEMFQVTDKYKLTADFIKRVIDPAKKELDKCSPYTFHYEQIKTGRKITGIRFIPIHQPQFDDPELKKKHLNKQMSNRWFIPKNIEDYLIYNFNFTDKELNNNLNLFEVLYNNLTEESLLDFLVELREPSSYADNQKAFIIGALKKKMEQIVEEKYLKK